ncbi:MAG: SpoIIE family protein phosphatase [Desulfovibrionaceae bacterium]
MSILIVDDSEFIHPQLKAYLSAGGHNDLVFCTSAAGAFEALGLGTPEAGTRGIELVIMDVLMPGMDGIEATRHIKSDPACEDLPVIITTADSGPEVLRTALEAGAVDYIPKPLHKVELLARVDSALRLKRETDRRMRQEEELKRLNREVTEAFERIAGEMDLVAGLQSMLLPTRSPRLPGVAVDSFYLPSGRASGDYFDYFRTGEDTLRLVVADVAGHGARAAFIMAVVRTLFHAGASFGLDVAQTLALVNTSLCETVGEADHVTIFAADLDLARAQLTYINAGHCPGLLLADPESVIQLPAQAPPAGFVQREYTACIQPVGERGRLFLFTDGLYEWHLDQERMFGMEPFLVLCEELLPKEERFLPAMEDKLRTLTGCAPEFCDDLTALLAEWDLAAFRAERGR